MFKLTFMPNLNRPINSIAIKTRLSLLMLWLRLLIKSLFVSISTTTRRIELTSSLINILHILNLNMSKTDPDSINFFYFIQNDTKFCHDYLNVIIDSFELVESLATAEMQPLVDSCRLETICILIKSVALKQSLSREQKTQVDEQLVKLQQQNVNFLKEMFANLNLTVTFIKTSVVKSERLFELALKFAIDILCTHGLFELNQTIAQLMTCFDIGISSVYIKNFLQVIHFLFSFWSGRLVYVMYVCSVLFSLSQFR